MALAPLNMNTGLPEALTAAQAQKVGQILHLLIARSTDQELTEGMPKQELVELIRVGIKTAKVPAPALQLSQQVVLNAASTGFDPVSTRAKQLRDAQTIRDHEAKYSGMSEEDIALLRVAESTGLA
ncbi:hypothetical protein [Paenarthrobacter ureafaciens]|uniref:hypothetical protein n=1 Tax=Paenarthrobacter ureafaciens TaxID=37931 RepID=UPI002DBE71CD|nr:hypothetical protein [Paenarthrobacter ureafaciens]MEC3853460.1 hypothetical protein [Paenarthrobacter ureafaciens]